MSALKTVRSYGALLPLAILRILLGFMFLWSFLDKMFGLGFSTTSANAMINGGSPTKGFLTYGTDTLSFLADPTIVQILDVVIMAAFLLLGIALILGIGMKIAAVGGTLLLLMMYVSLFPLTKAGSTNPIVDYHIMYIFLLWALYLSNAGDILGLGKWWKEQSLVARYPILE
ncbi:MAG: DoxX family membrane protein [Candidatus Methanomethylophilaceae archaeon]|nr:DoxX family membrane protein [Candidatus Methanomethylophilaceae archaeon]